MVLRVDEIGRSGMGPLLHKRVDQIVPVHVVHKTDDSRVAVIVVFKVTQVISHLGRRPQVYPDWERQREPIVGPLAQSAYQLLAPVL